MYTWKLGRSIPLNENFKGAVDELKALGFDAADVDLCAFWQDEEKELRSYEKIEESFAYLKDSGLFLNGVHISFGTRWDFSSLDDDFRQNVIRKTIDIFHRVDPFAPNCYNLHGSYEPIPDAERSKRIENLVDSLTVLKGATSTLLCVENLPRTCLMNTSSELRTLVDRVRDIKVCLDTNHFLQEKTEDAIWNLGDRIFTLHVSDCDYIDERHLLPGQGKIEWNKVIEALEKTGYIGVFNYEARGTSAQIKENFLTLFEKYGKKN